MENKTEIYNEQLSPLIQQINTIATAHGIPYSMVFQTSDADNWQSHYIPVYADQEMKQWAKWWLQDTRPATPDQLKPAEE